MIVNSYMLFLLISFVAGVLTVLAPCILPLLPVIIGGSAAGGSNKRAYTIIGSLIISIVIFTLLVKVSSVFLNVSPEFWKIFSGGILILLSVSYIFPSLWEKIPYLGKLSVSSNKALGKGFQKNTLWGDVLAGAALGPVFSTCSPTYFVILATVLPASFILGIVYLTAYALGLGIVLLLISLLGQRFADRLDVLSDPQGKFKKIIGALFLIVGLAIISGFDKKLSTTLLDAGFFDVTKVEQKLLEKVNIGQSESDTAEEQAIGDIELKNQGKYKELTGISGYLNTDGKEIKLSDYVGKKIILLDIMTYSCINCQRTVPYLNDWQKKYEDKGLVIIGIHAPEFAFEKNIKNVQKELVEKQGVEFPVVLDNDFTTWKAYKNQYWPHKYIIDINGDIVYDHIGEGAYAETEKVIQKLLETLPENSSGVSEGTTSFNFGDLRKVSSRETYLGYERMDYITNPIDRACADAVCDYTLQKSQKNTFSFGGKWKVENERSLAQKGSKLRYSFDAAKFHLVAGAPVGAKLKVTLDGTMVKMVDVREQTLYTLADFGQDYGQHTIEIEVVSGNPELYAITFG
jgi:cytochrome c biogenesis protein CcdA/thiol-disulfide isomerase/thioredoxin